MILDVGLYGLQKLFVTRACDFGENLSRQLKAAQFETQTFLNKLETPAIKKYAILVVSYDLMEEVQSLVPSSGPERQLMAHKKYGQGDGSYEQEGESDSYDEGDINGGTDDDTYDGTDNSTDDNIYQDTDYERAHTTKRENWEKLGSGRQAPVTTTHTKGPTTTYTKVPTAGRKAEMTADT